MFSGTTLRQNKTFVVNTWTGCWPRCFLLGTASESRHAISKKFAQVGDRAARRCFRLTFKNTLFAWHSTNSPLFACVSAKTPCNFNIRSYSVASFHLHFAR
jgi:hypothetical protein